MVTLDLQEAPLQHVVLHTILCHRMESISLQHTAPFGLMTFLCLADGSVTDVSCIRLDILFSNGRYCQPFSYRITYGNKI